MRRKEGNTSRSTVLPTSMFPSAFPSRPRGRQRLRAEPRAQGTPVSRHRQPWPGCREESPVCGRAEPLGTLRSPPAPRPGRVGPAGTATALSAARGEENCLLETVTVRLRGFGECMFYSFLKENKISWFYTVFLAAGLYRGGQPSRCPPCPSHRHCRDMSGSPEE